MKHFPKKIRFLMASALSLLMAGQLAAMPPHPSVIDKAKKDGASAVQRLAQRQQVMIKRGMNRPQRVFPTTGNAKILIIVIGYTDQAVNAASTATFFSNLLNGATTSALSMKKYYKDMSNGAFNLTIDVKGPYVAANTLNYYGANDANEYDVKPATLAGEAIDKAEADGVNFADYDNDGDGTVDTVMIIHAGVGEESGSSAPANAIWSHSWDLDSAADPEIGDGTGHRTYDGKTINGYTMQPEYVKNAGDTSIGVFCHEFGHVLGLPDLYDTTYETAGVGEFSLMAGGSWLGATGTGECPSPLLAWEKNLLGWLTLQNPDGTTVALGASAGDVRTAQSKTATAGVSLAILLGLGLVGFFGWRRRELRGILIPILALLMLPAGLVFMASCSDGGLGPGDSPSAPSLADIETSHTAVKIALGDPAGKQYYLLENKVVIAGTWTAYLPGSGLLISHIHQSLIDAYLSANAVNDNSNDGGTSKVVRIHGVNIVEADNGSQLWAEEGTAAASDLFKSRSFTPETSPKTQYYTATASPWSPSGKANSKVYIENISVAGPTMTFDYSFH